ncbi:hypothetical protein F3Y22_tig00113725pilonHSYRG00927 [Hibiscus syriacus]|uniref:RNase H type-1 domain-containing protein n=1 Tax=Hibiscus syriacus TaxID=106335 RepID=A0A6A2XHI4_HIBSY|nr:hypothetical protein F3Y22_tig00113725pilonHSYRG00927 [Hibiscus syriacus]
MSVYSPDPGWLCLNVDGAVSRTSGLGSIGSLIRDTNGCWIVGFHKSVGILDALHAELWAIFSGLQLAWSNAAPSFSSLVRAITRIRSKGWMTDICWLPRVENHIADAIAKLPIPPSHCATLFHEPPEAIQLLVNIDCIGPMPCEPKSA